MFEDKINNLVTKPIKQYNTIERNHKEESRQCKYQLQKQKVFSDGKKGN